MIVSFDATNTMPPLPPYKWHFELGYTVGRIKKADSVIVQGVTLREISLVRDDDVPIDEGGNHE